MKLFKLCSIQLCYTYQFCYKVPRLTILIRTELNRVPTQIFSTVETNFKMYQFWVMNHVNVQAKVSHIEWVAQGPVLVGGRWLLCTTPSAAKCLAHGTLAVMRWGASLPLHLPAALMIHPRYYRYCTIS